MTTYSSHQVIAATGATYRQLDYIARRGCLSAGATGAGSGIPREFTFHDAVIIACVARARAFQSLICAHLAANPDVDWVFIQGGRVVRSLASSPESIYVTPVKEIRDLVRTELRATR